MAREFFTAAELACPKCHQFGCECVTPPRAAAKADICTVCRRAKSACQCRSHVEHEAPPESVHGELLLNRQTPTDRIEAAVQEAMHYHYDTRDAQALARLVRDLATRVYRA